MCRFSGAAAGAACRQPLSVRRRLYRGAGGGVVTVEGAPASRRVYLFALPDMVCIDDVWADDNGEYRFSQLDTEKRFLVLARDHTGKYEPVSADNVKPEK
ncbi:hypothetical protein OCL44_02610 [Neisseria gonorrhoeae]|uniref:hypothetical protein n=1 Tax=Neisseria gonorrhoeae TaxID=485 RepID=UPI0021D86C12|nr:hypothetical protein [Neisseria gonorrhoeae]UXY76188.1 hypothetical protein OCL44_02610 [Neisseria gonorrhoeae]